MNKTAIKNFSVWATQKLIDDIIYKAKMLGITQEGAAEKLPHSTVNMHFLTWAQKTTRRFPVRI